MNGPDGGFIDWATPPGGDPDPGEPEYLSGLPLVGINGNAFAMVGQVAEGLRRAGAPKAYVDAVVEEMTSGDYDHLLAVAVRYTDPEVL